MVSILVFKLGIASAFGEVQVGCFWILPYTPALRKCREFGGRRILMSLMDYALSSLEVKWAFFTAIRSFLKGTLIPNLCNTKLTSSISFLSWDNCWGKIFLIPNRKMDEVSSLSLPFFLSSPPFCSIRSLQPIFHEKLYGNHVLHLHPRTSPPAFLQQPSDVFFSVTAQLLNC